MIQELRDLFSPQNNIAVSNFEYPYVETKATANLNFYGNPANLDTITIGSNVITFVTGVPAGLQVKIGGNQLITLANLVALINAHSSTLLVTATTNTIPTLIMLTATTSGTAGNALPLALSSQVLRFSAPTLINGGLFDFDNSEIFISDAVPQDYQSWPSIIVNTASAGETRYLGPEDSYDQKNTANVVVKDEIFSSLVATVDIKVYTIDDTLARDKIIDLIYNNMSELRHYLAVNGIEMIDRTLPTETRIVQNQRVYIENHFILRVYCEWSDNLDITNISSLSVTVPVDFSALPVVSSSLTASYSHGLQFVIDTVVDATHLTVASSYNMTAGNTITQGLNITTITTVVDNNHLVVGSTTGWVVGVATDTSINLPFSYIITATNSPTSYNAIGLPAGLIVDSSNGLISGVPTTPGTYYATISATNVTGTGTKSLTITVS
ncbi:MAG: Ig domain-containing protein [bacterium]